MSAMSAEGFLSVNPDLILAEERAGPPETLEVLAETQIPLISIPMGHDREALITKIRAVEAALEMPEKGEELARQVAETIDSATQQSGLTDKRVLFVLSLQGGRILTGGADTAAQGIIEMAGATNAVGGFEGYKPLGDEAVVTAAPDVILMMEAGRAVAVTDEEIFSHPAVADYAQLRDITFWSMGSLAGSNWSKIAIAAPLILIPLLLSPLLSVGLNGLSLGEAAAGHIGIRVQRLKASAVLIVEAATGLPSPSAAGSGLWVLLCRICCVWRRGRIISTC